MSKAFMSNGPDLPEEYRDIPKDFFRCGTGSYSDIILLPQPSDSPNDPLNVSMLYYLLLFSRCSIMLDVRDQQ